MSRGRSPATRDRRASAKTKSRFQDIFRRILRPTARSTRSISADVRAAATRSTSRGSPWARAEPSSERPRPCAFRFRPDSRREDRETTRVFAEGRRPFAQARRSAGGTEGRRAALCVSLTWESGIGACLLFYRSNGERVSFTGTTSDKREFFEIGIKERPIFRRLSHAHCKSFLSKVQGFFEVIKKNLTSPKY